MPIFDEAVIAAVLNHMNTDHPDDNLLIVRAFGSAEATAATMTGLDGLGATWHYQLLPADPERSITVPWSMPITERSEIRREIVVLYERSCVRVGVPSRND